MYKFRYQVLKVLKEKVKKGEVAPVLAESYADADFKYWYTNEFLKDRCYSSSKMTHAMLLLNDATTKAKVDPLVLLPMLEEVNNEGLAMNSLVESVPVGITDEEECKQVCENGFVFERTDYLGGYYVSITRPDIDRFYATIGIKHEENNRKRRKGFYLKGMNGNIDDLKSAIKNTQHLW